MRNLRSVTYLATALLFSAFMVSGYCFADEEVKKQALSAAKQWLTIIDNGQYEMCWEKTSPIIKQNVGKGPWAAAIGGAREPLGSVVNRAVKMSQFTATLPGAPNGEYVVIQFQTSFKNRPSAIETVTMRADLVSNGEGKEPSKIWNPAGYYIY